MRVPDTGPPGPLARRGPGHNRGSRPLLINSTHPNGNTGSRHLGATAVLETCVDQLDGLAGIASDAVVHGDPLDLVDVIAALDRIGRRLDSALVVLDLRAARP